MFNQQLNMDQMTRQPETHVGGRCEIVADVIVASVMHRNSIRAGVSLFMWHGWIREGDDAAWRCNFSIKDHL
jgi:hypothetical protein